MSKLRTFIEKELNGPQQEAVLQKNGSLLVIAGAGSGKTRVITSRIAHLMVHEQVHADSIVALTFTNKAAQEMQERIYTFLDKHTELPFIGTFHSYCLKLIKTNREIIDLSSFTIIDADDQEKIVQGIVQRNNLHKQVTAKQLQYQISFLKNQALNAAEQATFFAHNRLLQDVFHAYEQEKRLSKCLDFDDLLHYGLKLFSNDIFKARFQSSIRHILVDEYQDTNLIQHALLKAMCIKNKQCIADSICVVGDEDQSIYSWRGATITNMINFTKDFPKTKIVKIEQNYRSVQSILDVANHVIQHNKQRNPKQLWSSKVGTDRILSATCNSEYQEGDVIALLCSIAKSSSNLSSFAVLYRTHYQSRAIEEALIKSSIPYKIIGGIQFYERKEIKDILAYLRLLVNPFDRPSLFRVLNCPTRGLGAAVETAIYERWASEPFLTFVQLIEKLIEEGGTIKGKKKGALEEFIAIFTDISVNTAPQKATELILQRSGYVTYIKESYERDDAETRIENIEEFLRATAHFDAEKKGMLDQFLEEVALMQERSHKQINEQTVFLMTYHAAKGLEFDTIILVGLEEGLLPSTRSLSDESALEEERRLFYVGITRAKERLFLSRSRFRYSFGKMNTQTPSRFVNEIPNKLLVTHDFGNLQPYTIRSIISQWLNNEQRNTASSEVLTFGKKTTATKKALNGLKTVESREITPKSQPAQSTNSFKVHQPVKHATFGIGRVTKIEARNDVTYVSVQFKNGVKKLVSSFLQLI